MAFDSESDLFDFLEPEDFIVVSEFSELEGPVPLFTVPEAALTGSAAAAFDINEFVLKIMAVDFQNKSTDVTLGSTGSEDTQVVMPIVSSGGDGVAYTAYAYVHHLTLLDICARGYVRPIALSYVTHEPDKIMGHFSQLHAAFSKCAAMYKQPNRDVFRRDVESRLADALRTLDALRRRGDQSADGSSSDGGAHGAPPAGAAASDNGDEREPLPTLASITEHVADLQRLRLQLRPAPGASSSARPATATAAAVLLRPPPSAGAAPALSSASTAAAAATDASSTADAPNMSSTAAVDLTVDGWCGPAASGGGGGDDGERAQPARGDSPALDRRNSVAATVAPLSAGNVDDDSTDRVDVPNASAPSSATTLASPSSAAAVADVRAGLTDEAAPAAPSRGELRPHTPSSASATTTRAGAPPAGESELGSEEEVAQHLRQHQQLLSPLHKAYYYNNAGGLRTLEELATADAANQARLALANVVSSMRLPRLALHLMHLDRQLLAQPSSSASLLSIGESLVHSFALRPPPPPAAPRPLLSRVGTAVAATGGGTLLSAAVASATVDAGRAGASLNSSSSSLTSWATPVSHLSAAEAPMLVTGGGDDESGTAAGLESDLDPMSSPPAAVGPEFEADESVVDSWSAAVWGLSRRGWGRGLLKLRLKCPQLLRCAAYTLLTGRPLLVLAHSVHERKARKLVAALAALVPGHTGRGGRLSWGNAPLITPWWSGPQSLRLADVACTKLIGVAKRGGLMPKLLERYCSVWDLEAETFFGPPYPAEGKLVDDVLAFKKQWPDEDTYLAWLHWRLLEAASKAGLYFYLCCVGVPDPRSSPDSAGPAGSSSSRSLLGGVRAQQSPGGGSVLMNGSTGSQSNYNGFAAVHPGGSNSWANVATINHSGGSAGLPGGGHSHGSGGVPAAHPEWMHSSIDGRVDSQQQQHRSMDWTARRNRSHTYFSASSFGSPSAAGSRGAALSTDRHGAGSVRLLPVMGDTSRQAWLSKLQVAAVDEPIIQAWVDIVKEQYQCVLLGVQVRTLAPSLRVPAEAFRLVSNHDRR